MSLEGYKKFFILLGFFSFFLFGFLGIMHFGINMDGKGQMTNCPFMGHSAICKMNPLEHLSAWQRMFTVTPTEKDFTLLLLLISFGVLIYRFIDFQKYLRDSHSLFVSVINLPEKSISFALQEAFSNGILNPKIF